MGDFVRMQVAFLASLLVNVSGFHDAWPMTATLTPAVIVAFLFIVDRERSASPAPRS